MNTVKQTKSLAQYFAHNKLGKCQLLWDSHVPKNLLLIQKCFSKIMFPSQEVGQVKFPALQIKKWRLREIEWLD